MSDSCRSGISYKQDLLCLMNVQSFFPVASQILSGRDRETRTNVYRSGVASLDPLLYIPCLFIAFCTVNSAAN